MTKYFLSWVVLCFAIIQITDHMKNVLENVTDTFLVELVKNRYEIWDQESTISSESKPSVHELRSILAATS